MSLSLRDYDRQAREAVMAFWGNREKAREKQLQAGIRDAGERAGVTAGNNMDGFLALLVDLVRHNGPDDATICTERSLLTLPGYFRPTKTWDVLVFSRNRLVAAVELKSQVGPSFGNNFNNRAEEAIGMAFDFEKARRRGALGKGVNPFVGWLMLVEDEPRSQKNVSERSPHFAVLPEFSSASYLRRYDLLCQRLVDQRLYTAACIVASPREAVANGVYRSLSAATCLRSFVASFAGHFAAEAARG